MNEDRLMQFLSILFVLTLATVVSAQTPATCGIVGIDGPSEVDPGRPLVFKVSVANMVHTSRPEFRWSVSAGTIMKGQLTDEIMVDTSGLAGQNVIATVELANAQVGCNNSASKTTAVKSPLVCRAAFDMYGDIKFEDEKARLDNFAIQLMNVQGSGLIQMEAGRKTFKGEAVYRLARAKSYLVGFRRIESQRIVTVDCGFTEKLAVRLWVVPPGATLPECETAGKIPLSEVKFTKPRPKSSKKRR